MGPKDSAKQMVAAFRAGTRPSVWRHLHRATVADELESRVDDPTLIRQGHVDLCGPAAFLQSLATDDPEHYVRMAAELFSAGMTHMIRGTRGVAGGKFLRPDDDVRDYPIPRGPEQVAEADWLLLASIRQAYDFWGWEHFHEARSGEGKTPQDVIARFFKDTGYQKVVNRTRPEHYHSLIDLIRARDYYDQGYRVVLIINTDLLVPVVPYIGKDELNHAVTLYSTITGIPNHVRCVVFTWGTTHSVPRPPAANGPPLSPSGEMTVATFLKYFFGFIAAKY